MEREEVISRLTPIAQKTFNQPDMTLMDSLSAANVESWTSLSFMQLLTAIEEEFGFKFKMMELLSLKTMGDIINAICAH